MTFYSIQVENFPKFVTVVRERTLDLNYINTFVNNACSQTLRCGFLMVYIVLQEVSLLMVVALALSFLLINI
jgi:hypothetical protein